MLLSYIVRMGDAGSRTAFIEEGAYRAHTYTYVQVLERARAFAAWLGEHEMAQPTVNDDRGAPRVVIWAVPSARWAIAFYGCLLAGYVVVPVDVGFSLNFVERVAAHTEASLIAVDERRTIDGEKAFESPIGNRQSSISLPSVFQLAELDTLSTAGKFSGQPHAANRRGSRDTLAEIIYTSGTTAEPRGVMITHGNLLANLEPVEREIRKRQWLAAPFRPLRFLHLIPLSHLFGQIMGLFFPQLLQAEVVFPESQSPSELARIIRKRRVSVMVSVPQQLEALGDWAVAINQKSEIRNRKTGDRSRESGVESGSRNPKSEIASLSLPARFWKFRRLHRALGWKMWAFVVGGAALPPRVERLWNDFGYAVIQGYGLTETAPAITVTHPFKIRHGSVGQPLPGAEIRLADDGEILVRGANVSPGYYRNQEATQITFVDGWLRTGDLGRFDAEGNLIFIGRKKDVIVTADGLKVYPDDVERVLADQPGIREAALVGRETGRAGARRTLVHAVVVPEKSAGPEVLEAAVARANERLEPHQRIRGYSMWPQAQLPRTVSTHKLQRAAVAAWVNRAEAGSRESGVGGRESLVGNRQSAIGNSATPDSRLPTLIWRDFLVQLGVARDRIQPEARLSEDLGLSSLDRVELLTWLETQGASVDGERLTQAHTVADLERIIEVGVRSSGFGIRKEEGDAGCEVPDLQSEGRGLPFAVREIAGPSSSANPELRTASREFQPPAPGTWLPAPEPRWPRSWPARAFRVLATRLLMFPLLRTYVRTEVVGAEKLAHLAGPVLWIANHQSLLDVIVILRALPTRLRRRVAPAMGIDAVREGPVPDTARSEAWLHLARPKSPEGGGPQISKTLTLLARLFFCAYLLPEDASGVQHALRHAGLLADEGFSTLIFPEGVRTPNGRIGRFQPGAALMAARLRLPVVPLRLDGLYEIWAAAARGPQRGRARVTILNPVEVAPGESAAQFTARLQSLYESADYADADLKKNN